MKPSISNLYVLFFSCVVQKATTHIGTKELHMLHQAQKGFRGIFFGITQHQKGYLVYVPHKHKILSSYNVVFDESFLVLWRTRHNHIQKQCLREYQCRTYHMLHLQREKLEI